MIVQRNNIGLIGAIFRMGGTVYTLGLSPASFLPLNICHPPACLRRKSHLQVGSSANKSVVLNEKISQNALPPRWIYLNPFATRSKYIMPSETRSSEIFKTHLSCLFTHKLNPG